MLHSCKTFPISRWDGLFFVLLVLGLAGLEPCVGSSVSAWGAGEINDPSDGADYGQSIIPANLTNAVQVAAGGAHSLAVKADGTIEAWGDNTYGQLDFPAGTNYEAVAAGELFGLALVAGGTAVGAGDDYYGQTDVPANLTNAVAVDCGFYHSLALKSDGTVSAWGAGEINDPNDPSGVDYGQSIVPPGLSNVVAISAGGYFNLALKSDGTVVAWGDDSAGNTNLPAGLTNVVAISAGGFHSLALLANGTVVSWGTNNFGQTNVPIGLSNVVAIAAGEFHSLALKSNGTVVAWGAGETDNPNDEVDYGQSIVPTNLTNVQQIAAGDLHSLALVNHGPPPAYATLAQPKFGTNGFSASLPTLNGRVYQLQYRNFLANGPWQSLLLQAGTGGNLKWIDPAMTSQRFYRAQRW